AGLAYPIPLGSNKTRWCRRLGAKRTHIDPHHATRTLRFREDGGCWIGGNWPHSPTARPQPDPRPPKDGPLRGIIRGMGDRAPGGGLGSRKLGAGAPWPWSQPPRSPLRARSAPYFYPLLRAEDSPEKTSRAG